MQNVFYGTGKLYLDGQELGQVEYDFKVFQANIGQRDLKGTI